MSVVARVGLVLLVRNVDRNTPGLLFRRGVDFIVLSRKGETLGLQNAGDGGGQGCLAVVNVADGANIDVRLLSLKFSSSHFSICSLLAATLGL